MMNQMCIRDRCKYLELLDSLRSLARYCRYGKKLTSPKKMLLGV